MDPQTTWNEMHAAVAECDWDRVEELADALLEWIVKGGFPPKTFPQDKLTKSWHKDVTYCVCHLALASVKKARNRASGRKAHRTKGT